MGSCVTYPFPRTRTILEAVQAVGPKEEANIEDDVVQQPASSYKLDLRYFTLPQFCPG